MSIENQNVSCKFMYFNLALKCDNNCHIFLCYEIQCACHLKIVCTDIGIDRTARKFQTISGKTRLAWPVLVRPARATLLYFSHSNIFTCILIV